MTMISTDTPEQDMAGDSSTIRTVKVTGTMIAAARAQVEISRQLGRAVPRVVEKIAQVR